MAVIHSGENKTIEFVSFCVEQYKKRHGLSGVNFGELFEKMGVVEYLAEGYGVLHTQGLDWIVADIEKFSECEVNG